jgi:hypothetical protein
VTTTDEALAALRQRWGTRWEIWYVPLALGGNTWCARRHDNHRRLLHGHTPDELEEYLADAEH